MPSKSTINFCPERINKSDRPENDFKINHEKNIFLGQPNIYLGDIRMILYFALGLVIGFALGLWAGMRVEVKTIKTENRL